MKQYPAIPPLENAPETLLATGHLWLLEKIDGAPLRFQLQESGLIRFGDRTRVYADADSIPDSYQHAVRYVREHLDRDALRRAVADVESVVFFGEATHRHTIEYDWERMPSFLGFDVWSAETETFRPPDATVGIFDHLGLESVPVVDREVRPRDFDPGTYSIPDSAWYDGPAEGIIIRNKTGDRAQLCHPECQDRTGAKPVEAPAEALAREYATTARFNTVATTLEAARKPVTTETLFDRVLESICREYHHQLDGVEMAAFRSELGALTQAYLRER